MSTERTWTRRSLIRRLGWIGLLGTFGGVRGIGMARRGTRAAAALEPEDFFDHVESAAAVGREYLRLVPEERDAARLRQRILADCRETMGVGRPGRRLRAAVMARQRIDFEAGRTVRIDGWVLSRTEARLCGLAALGA
jgi:hypothetical protein